MLCDCFYKRKTFFRIYTDDFAEGSKMLLDTNLKIILLDHQNNFVGSPK